MRRQTLGLTVSSQFRVLMDIDNHNDIDCARHLGFGGLPTFQSVNSKKVAKRSGNCFPIHHDECLTLVNRSQNLCPEKSCGERKTSERKVMDLKEIRKFVWLSWLRLVLIRFPFVEEVTRQRPNKDSHHHHKSLQVNNLPPKLLFSRLLIPPRLCSARDARRRAGFGPHHQYPSLLPPTEDLPLLASILDADPFALYLSSLSLSREHTLLSPRLPPSFQPCQSASFPPTECDTSDNGSGMFGLGNIVGGSEILRREGRQGTGG